MTAVRQLLILAACGLVALPVLAQADRGSGVTPMGRRGATWQTEQGLEQEELRAFKAELEQLTEEEWKKRALAWLTFDVAEGAMMTVEDSYHVANLDAGKKASVAMTGDEDYPEWEISFGKKKPKDLDLTLTDNNSTRVSCPLANTFKLHAGYLGVFQHEGTLVCMQRGSGAAS